MQENWYELMETVQRKQELERVLACNEKTKSFGLTLTEEDAGRLMASRRDSLRTQMRVEFGKGVLPEIIETFCDSPCRIPGLRGGRWKGRVREIFTGSTLGQGSLFGDTL